MMNDIVSNQRQRVAVIGSGAVGSYYGARLAQAGHDVRFLMRRDYEAVRTNGLRVISIDGDFTLDNPKVFLKSQDIGQVDWILCSMKATSIKDALELIQPCVSDDTRIIVLMNGIGVEEPFTECFESNQIFGGIIMGAFNRGEPGHIHHLSLGSIVLGHYQNDRDEIKIGTDLWNQSKVTIVPSNSLLCSRWEKLCWNIPYNGLSVAAGGVTLDKITGNPELMDIARSIMREIIEIGNADLAANSEEIRIDTAGAENLLELTHTLGAYRTSTMIDYVEGRPIEVEALFEEPLRRAQLHGIETPYLTLLTALIKSLDANNQ